MSACAQKEAGCAPRVQDGNDTRAEHLHVEHLRPSGLLGSLQAENPGLFPDLVMHTLGQFFGVHQILHGDLYS